jgi:uncharacterized protein with HEPN domain
VKSQRAYVQHVIECIGRIAEDSAPGRHAVFASRTLQDAIVRNVQVLCESTQRIDELHKQRYPEIDRTSIAGMRNVLVHDYFEVDFETVWDVVARDLLRLRRRCTPSLLHRTKVLSSIREKSEEWKQAGAFFKAHAIQALAIEIAEATAEWLHRRIREHWGFPDAPTVTMHDRFTSKYHGKRYSFG